MVDETTTEQLAEIEAQGELITGPGLYQARCGDLVQITRWRAGWWVSEWKGIRTDYHSDGRKRLRTEADAGRWDLLHWVAPLPASEPEPETTTEQPAEIEGQVEPVQVREGRWRTRNGLVKDVTAMPKDHEDFAAAYPWWDGVSTWRNDGRWLAGGSTMDLLEYLGPIEPDKTQELPDKTQELETKTQELPEYTPPEGWRVLAVGEVLREGDVIVHTDDAMYATARVGGWVGANQRYIRPIEPQPQPQPEVEPNAAAIEELRSEVSYVQRLLGESRQRVTHLEELVTSLRTINEAQEKSFNAANKANDDLQHRLNVVAAEWAEQAETIRRLQIELDAAQQVPQAIADRFEEGWNQGTARAVETVLEWLEPVRLVDSPNLANETLQHLPQIMRSLTGLAQD